MTDEYVFWSDFINTGGFKYLVNVYKKHANYLKEEVINLVGKGEVDEAKVKVGVIKDLKKQVKLIEERIKEVSRGSND